MNEFDWEACLGSVMGPVKRGSMVGDDQDKRGDRCRV